MDNFENYEVLDRTETAEETTYEVREVPEGSYDSSETSIVLDTSVPEKKSSSLKDKLIGMAIGATATALVVAAKKTWDWGKAKKEEKAQKKKDEEEFKEWKKKQQKKEEPIEVTAEEVEAEAKTETEEPKKEETKTEEPKKDKKK